MSIRHDTDAHGGNDELASPAVDDLHFDPVAHTYTLRGRRLESVTQVLEDVGISDFSSIPPSTRNEALKRGSVVHEAIAIDIENDLDESSVPAEYLGYVLAARRFRAECRFEAELHEYRSYHPQFLYSGTLDAKGTAIINGARRKVLLDWKSGVASSWVRYQLAAYCGFFPSPGAEMRICVEIHKDGTYQIFVFLAAEFRADFDVFLSALTVMRVKRMDPKL